MQICPHHIRTYDNTLADLGTRQFEKGFDVGKLTMAKRSLRQSAKAKGFDTKPRRCEMARPEIFDLYSKYRASMDVWGGSLSESELNQLEALLPSYLRSEGESALTLVKPV